MLTRSLLAAAATLLAVSAAPVTAADLDRDYGPSPYDDPRYSDIYRHPAPPPPPPRYAERYDEPPRHYRDEPRYVPAPQPPGPYDRQSYRGDAGCLPQQVIRDRLTRRGWHDFHDPHVAGNLAHVRARRPNGRLFDLTVDRCSGEVLGAERIDERYAGDTRPWRSPDDGYRRY